MKTIRVVAAVIADDLDHPIKILATERGGVRIFFWTILVVLTLSLSFLCILLDSCRPR